jgi:hypothetical protein
VRKLISPLKNPPSYLLSSASASPLLPLHVPLSKAKWAERLARNVDFAGGVYDAGLRTPRWTPGTLTAAHYEQAGALSLDSQRAQDAGKPLPTGTMQLYPQWVLGLNRDSPVPEAPLQRTARGRPKALPSLRAVPRPWCSPVGKRQDQQRETRVWGRVEAIANDDPQP